MTTTTFATFQLDQQLFGIEILYVREVNKQLDMTPVPHAPDYVRGLLNLRGQIVTILDLKKRLSSTKTQVSGSSCNLILKTEQELNPIRQREKRPDLATSADPVGLMIDSIDEIVTVDTALIADPPVNMDPHEQKYLSGVVTLDKRLLGILSVDKILEYTAKASKI